MSVELTDAHLDLTRIKHKKPRRRTQESPGEDAHPTHQGDTWMCTLHSVAKAMVDGCMKEVFRTKPVIDLLQQDILDELTRRWGGAMIRNGKWPEELSAQKDFEFICSNFRES